MPSLCQHRNGVPDWSVSSDFFSSGLVDLQIFQGPGVSGSTSPQVRISPAETSPRQWLAVGFRCPWSATTPHLIGLRSGCGLAKFPSVLLCRPRPQVELSSFVTRLRLCNALCRPDYILCRMPTFCENRRIVQSHSAAVSGVAFHSDKPGYFSAHRAIRTAPQAVPGVHTRIVWQSPSMTPMPSSSLLTIASYWLSLSMSGSTVHHSHAWVSSTITAILPSRLAQLDQMACHTGTPCRARDNVGLFSAQA